MRGFAWFRWLVAALAVMLSTPSLAEDGYDLWLRYRPVEAAAQARYRAAATAIVRQGDSPTLSAAADELRRGLGGLLARPIAIAAQPVDGAVVIGTPASSPLIQRLNLPLQNLGREGFLIRSATVSGHRVTIIAANSDVGVLYGAFRLLRLIQTRQPIADLDISDAPHVELRMLDHWDNLDRHVVRGYSGLSLWDWQTLPRFRDPRYTDYARADASIGINGIVLNNVSSNADVMTPRFLERVRVLADIFRPYGIRVYLSARFNAPMALGALPTADPLDPRVRAWWRAKADEIYRYIPDFGGFLVKANSEGTPGPQDFHRTHADGANMMADALAPHGGVVIWRAFVYSAENEEDRFRQAYSEFHRFDGQFRDNVIVQVKNGPIDFQPREPFSPLFGAMPRTAIGMEFQVTKEYLGFNTHLAYLGTMWEEVLRSDTYARGQGSTVARVIDGSLFHGRHSLPRRRRQHRQRPQLVRLAIRSGQLVRARPLRLGSRRFGARGRRGLGADDLGQRPGRGPARGRDDDGIAPGRGRLHDPARPPSSDGDRPSLWAGALDRQSGAPRLEPGLFPRRQSRRHRLRPHRHRQQRDRAICAGGGAPVRQSGHGRRRFPARLPSSALDPPARHRPDALGRAGRPLFARRRRSAGDAADLGGAGGARRCAAPRRGRRLPRHPGGRGPVVARRLHRLFPEPVAPALARRLRAAGPRSRLL